MRKLEPSPTANATTNQDLAARPTPIRFGIREASAALGISRAQLYVRIQQGAIRTHKDGARTFISQAELERYVRTCEERSKER